MPTAGTDPVATTAATVWLVVPLAPDMPGPSEVFASFDAVRRAYPGDWQQHVSGTWILKDSSVDVYGIEAFETEVRDG